MKQIRGFSIGFLNKSVDSRARGLSLVAWYLAREEWWSVRAWSRGWYR